MSKSVFHISFDPKLPRVLVPRQPYGSDELGDPESPTREDLPDRVSFSPTIIQCFLATYANYSHYFEDERYNYPYMDGYVYEARVGAKTRRISHEDLSEGLHDYFLTEEIAVLDPIRVTKVGRIRIHAPSKTRAMLVMYQQFGRGDWITAAPVCNIEILEEDSENGIVMGDWNDFKLFKSYPGFKNRLPENYFK